MSNPNADPSGIYIHVPFCLSKCRYCNFYSETAITLIDDYVSALCQEMVSAPKEFNPANTIYFGGGTPSLLTERQLARILGQIDRVLEIAEHKEVTLEINPATIDLQGLRHLKKIGVNRLNIGIQSFNADHLRFLGRIHSPTQAVAAFNSARKAGFENIGVDMIYGLPYQDIGQWENDLKTVVDLDPAHISCYILTYEPGTPLHQDLISGKLQALDDSRLADMFLMTHALLESTGYDHYEISNFAKKGSRSIHNEKYWNFNDYLGLGPAAHSYHHHNRERWWNHDSTERYLKCIREGRSPVDAHEHLNIEQQLIEAVFLGLRQSKGVNFKAFGRRFGSAKAAALKTGIRPWIGSGHAVSTRRSCYLTTEGMLISDRIISDLIDII